MSLSGLESTEGHVSIPNPEDLFMEGSDSFKLKKKKDKPKEPTETDAILPKKQQKFFKKAFSGLPSSVFYIVMQAFFASFAQFVVNPLILAYLKRMNWYSLSLFSVVVASGLTVPVIFNPIFGLISSRASTKKVMILVTILSLIGNVLMLLPYLWVFFLGYTLSMMQVALRPVRLNYINRIVSPEKRTMAISFNPALNALGAIIGAAATVACTKMPSIKIESLHDYVFDEFSATLCLAIISCIETLVLLIIWFKEVPITPIVVERQGFAATSSWTTKVILDNKATVSAKTAVILVFSYFFSIMFLSQLSVGIYQVSFLPIIQEGYHFTTLQLSAAVFVLAVLAIIPPVFVAIFSSKFEDRTFLAGGIFLQLIGMICYSIPPMASWQVLLGYALVVKSSLFILPCAMALFSKLLERKATGMLVGFLASATGIGPIVGAIVGGATIMHLFKKWYFLLFSVPTFISCMLLLAPPFYSRLDLKRKFVKDADAQIQ